jgi:hypothetical protein
MGIVSCVLFFVVPDRTRQEVQIQTQQHNGVGTRVFYREALDATRQIVANRGITGGLYRGLTATCCRQGPSL